MSDETPSQELPEGYVRPVVAGPIDGNAFAVLGAVSRALRKAGLPKEFIEQAVKEMTTGNYDHLLSTAQRYVDFDL